MFCPPTLDEVFQQIPEEVRQYIITSCDIGDKDSGELHKILMSVRARFALPPWSPITLYFKLLARPVRHGRMFSHNNAWVNSGLDLVVQDIPSSKQSAWVRLRVTMERGDKKEPPFVVAVHPYKKLMWSYNTELPINSRKIGTGNSSVKGSGVAAKWLYNQAAQYVKAGYKNGAMVDVTYTINTSRAEASKRTNAALYEKRMNKIASELAGMAVNEPPISESTAKAEPKPAQPKPALKPIEVKSVIFAEDAEMLLTMCDVACQKLKEIGCEETAKRWKQRVYKLVGKESNE